MLHLRRGGTRCLFGFAVAGASIVAGIGAGGVTASLGSASIAAAGPFKVEYVTVPLHELRNPWTTPLLVGPDEPVPEPAPAVPPAEYRAAKEAAAASRRPRPLPPASSTPVLQARTATRSLVAATRRSRLRSAPSQVSAFAGTYAGTPTGGNCAAGTSKPDTFGATGTQYFGEVTNRCIEIYYKSNGQLVTSGSITISTSLATFFSYTARAFSDPRIIKDSLSSRWIVTAEALAESSTTQWFFIAVSQTQDVRGNYYFYQLNMKAYTGSDVFDFPQAGVDQNALLFTGNSVNEATQHIDSSLFVSAPKSQILSGGTTTFTIVYNISEPSLAPPIVLDSNSTSYVVSAPPGAPSAANALTLFAVQGDGNPSTTTFTYRATIPVVPYVTPAYAGQCGADPLNTSDARFSSPSTQVGNSLWQIHTPSYDDTNGAPTPRFYEINTATNTLNQWGRIYATTTSDDYNASITANTSGDVFVTWSSSQGGGSCVNPQIRFSGRQSTDPLGQIGSGAAMFQSPTAWEFSPGGTQSWGDYSMITLDPLAYTGCAANKRAWLVNEKVNNQTIWGSIFGGIGFC